MLLHHLHVTAGIKFPHWVAIGISLYKWVTVIFHSYTIVCSNAGKILLNLYSHNNNINNKLSLWLFIPWSMMFYQAYDQVQSDFLQLL
jgi:hypothetical protein